MDKRYIPALEMELSPLGLGAMRIPVENKTIAKSGYQLIEKAVEDGINYFDTGYYYMGGLSEVLLRETLVKKYPRDDFFIADKLTATCIERAEDMERIFETQIERLGTPYIDIYLLHAMTRARWKKLYELGVLDFLDQKKREGRIRKIGFSFHDAVDVLQTILDHYPWDVVQLQIDYFDWVAQNAKASYEILAERGIPCTVMGPVGGGRLAALPDEIETLLKGYAPDKTLSSWAVRFVGSLSNVVVTLSGMQDEYMLADNIAQFTPFKPLERREQDILTRAAGILMSYRALPCTGCGYCTEQCPKKIDIPQIIKRYNDYRSFQSLSRPFAAEHTTEIFGLPRVRECVQCGRCRENCPQKIDIPKEISHIYMESVWAYLGGSASEFDALLQNDAGNRLLVFFGAGKYGEILSDYAAKRYTPPDFFCDNAREKWGQKVNGVKVLSPRELCDLQKEHEVCALITTGVGKQRVIVRQLDELNIPIALFQKRLLSNLDIDAGNGRK